MAESILRPFRVRVAAVWVGVAATALLLGTGAAEAAPPAGEPFGAPIDVTVTNAQQNAIVGGAAASAVGVTCVSSGGGACAVAGAVSGFVTPLVAGEIACPNEGVRRIRLQPVQQPPTMSNPEGTRFKVISNNCVPA